MVPATVALVGSGLVATGEAARPRPDGQRLVLVGMWAPVRKKAIDVEESVDGVTTDGRPWMKNQPWPRLGRTNG